MGSLKRHKGRLSLYTVETALEALRKYDITRDDLISWESALGLDIPVDSTRQKQYSAHHINLFKNVKKHLALGRTIDEIRNIIILPSLAQSRVESSSSEQSAVSPQFATVLSSPQASQMANRNQAIGQQAGIRNSQQSASSVTNSSEAVSRMAVSSGESIQAQRKHEPVAPPAAQFFDIKQRPQTYIAEASGASAVQQQASQGVALKEALNHSLESTTTPIQNNQVQSSKAVAGYTTSSYSAPPPVTSEPPSAKPLESKNPYTSIPRRAVLRSPKTESSENSAGGAAKVLNLVQRLAHEKDALYKKLMETEKLNSHLYSANSLFHKKANEMSRQINQLKQDRNEMERFKLLDDKSRLHKQLLDAERLTQQKQDDILQREKTIYQMQTEIEKSHKQIKTLSAAFNPEKFKGDWLETANLLEVAYDNFGINIESERVRLFRIPEVPNRLYGSSIVINTTYHYENNSLWKRHESLMVAYTSDDLLQGELTAEYVLDGVPVAKALYKVSCRRK
jgi:DNA-binding transcriptional MerR regulator